jgi:Domain of unknown function (DUF1918)
MPDVGDRVRMHAIKVDQAPREGVVTSVSGSLLRIKWSTGEETTMVPGPGSVAVIGKVKQASSKKATAPAKAAKPTKSAPKGKAAKKPTR